MSKQSVNLTELAHNYLLECIYNKEFLPGEKIPECRIAEELGISRTPVREAIRLLSNEGIVDILPNRFALLSEYNFEKTRDLCILRIALEQLAIKQALMYGSQADFLELKKLAEACLDATAKIKDVKSYSKLDCSFHQMLAEISKNSLLVDINKGLFTRVQYLILHYDYSKYTQYQAQQHLELANALINRDKDVALICATKHLISFYQMEDTFPQDLL